MSNYYNDYPKNIKAFYMRLNDDGKTVATMDMLVPRVGAPIGGSQREERLDYLDKRLDELKVSKESLWWYRDLRRYGTGPPSNGVLPQSFMHTRSLAILKRQLIRKKMVKCAKEGIKLDASKS